MLRLPRSPHGTLGALPPPGVPSFCSIYPSDPACQPPPEPKVNWAAVIIPPVVASVAVFIITRKLDKMF